MWVHARFFVSFCAHRNRQNVLTPESILNERFQSTTTPPSTLSSSWPACCFGSPTTPASTCGLLTPPPSPLYATLPRPSLPPSWNVSCFRSTIAAWPPHSGCGRFPPWLSQRRRNGFVDHCGLRGEVGQSRGAECWAPQPLPFL